MHSITPNRRFQQQLALWWRTALCEARWQLTYKLVSGCLGCCAAVAQPCANQAPQTADGTLMAHRTFWESAAGLWFCCAAVAQPSANQGPSNSTSRRDGAQSVLVFESAARRLCEHLGSLLCRSIAGIDSGVLLGCDSVVTTASVPFWQVCRLFCRTAAVNVKGCAGHCWDILSWLLELDLGC